MSGVDLSHTNGAGMRAEVSVMINKQCTAKLTYFRPLNFFYFFFGTVILTPDTYLQPKPLNFLTVFLEKK